MKILVAESQSFDEGAVRKMREAGHEVKLGEHTAASLAQVVGEYDGLIVRLGIVLDGELLRRAEILQFIATPTTGIDHIDGSAASERGIEVISLRGERAFLDTITPTAELTFALILALYRHLMPAAASVRNGAWDRNKFIGRELKGKQLGIVGMGRLGSMVARAAESFGVQVLYFDPYVADGQFERVASLHDVAARADIVSVHVPLNEETRGLIGSDFFAGLGRGSAIFINTSRGAVVDEPALLAALERGMVAGAGLDVLADELSRSAADNALVRYAREHENVIVTPHIGGATWDAMRACERFVVDKVLAFCEQREPARSDEPASGALG